MSTLPSAAQSRCCRQLSTVTTLSLSSHYVVTKPSRWLMEKEFTCVNWNEKENRILISLTLSILKRTSNCTTRAFCGSVKILTSISSFKDFKLTFTGNRPQNSGISPNLIKSWASTCCKRASFSSFSSWALCPSGRWERASLVTALRPLLVLAGAPNPRYCKKAEMKR